MVIDGRLGGTGSNPMTSQLYCASFPSIWMEDCVIQEEHWIISAALPHPPFSLIAVASKVQSALLTPENAELIRQSTFTLLSTLKNIESISTDVSGFTGDEATRQNLKLLIKSLSRIL